MFKELHGLNFHGGL